MALMTAPLLRVRGLAKTFHTADRRAVRALAGVDLDVAPGGALGLVGESGSGKSTLGRALLRLIEADAGSILFRERDLRSLSRRAMRRERRHLQMVFQDPFASLNPRQRVEAMLAEPLVIHGQGDAGQRRAAVEAMLEAVGLRPDDADKFPHQFSGGQRQRLAIARAGILNPALIVADEPVSALDVSVRSQILNLLSDLRRDRGVALILIAHDLAVVGQVCDWIAVMYLGGIVEEGPSERLLADPVHPYTRALVGSVYGLGEARRPRQVLAGDPPDPANVPPGCAFQPRCPQAFDLCRSRKPSLTLRQVGTTACRTACHLYPEVEPQREAEMAAQC